MTNKTPDNGQSRLQDRIQQRKAEQIRREADARIIARQTGTAPTVNESPKPAQNADLDKLRNAHKRATITARPVAPARKTNHGRIMVLVGAIVFLTAVGVVMTISTGSTNAASAPMPTSIPMDTATTQIALDYLRSVDIEIRTMRSLEVPNNRWNARDGIEVSLDLARTGGVGSGNIRILTYDSIDQANRDAFSVTIGEDHPFRAWHVVQVSNVVVLAPPDVRPELVQDIVSHLTTLMLRPYRDFMPTATPKQ
jgi:hypothetical protein